MSLWITLARWCRGVRPLALRSSLSALAVCAACSAGAPDEAGSDHATVEDELADVVYQGQVTDEALLRLLDSAPQPEAQPQLSVCVPQAGAGLVGEAPIEFSFARQSCALEPDARIEPRSMAAPSPERHAANAGTRAAREPLLSVLLSAFAPIGVAHAHGAPFNGTGYYLRVVDAAGEVSMQAFTDATTYTPTQAQWTRMAESTGPLRLEIVWAEFDNNEVAGNGPFEARPVSFQLQK